MSLGSLPNWAPVGPTSMPTRALRNQGVVVGLSPACT